MRAGRGPPAARRFASDMILALGRLVRFSHTIFALPFAVLGFLWGVEDRPFDGRAFLWVLAAMVSARTAAMAFNRLVDLRYDRENPRTLSWPLVQGEVTVRAAWTLFATAGVFFFVSAARLNATTLALSPLAFVLVTGYSFTKRFTPLCHLVLGLALACAPAGGWLAVQPALWPVPLPPLLLAATVLFWVAGFDVIYACQDAVFDRVHGLHSIPAGWGVARALRAARIFHAAAAAALAAAGGTYGAGPLFWAGWAFFAIMLVYEHAIIGPEDMSRVNAAFFTVNGVVSIFFCTAAAADWLSARAG